jgi:nucleoside-diphosphate-sugar epimerase
MKIFVAGATGAIGRRLLPLLVSSGHEVVAMTHAPARTDALRALGAQPVVADGLDRDAVMRAVTEAHPDVIVHEMTALESVKSLSNFDRDLAVTNQLRTEGTEYLIEAAHAAGTRKLVAQSFTGWPNERTGGRIKTETDELDKQPPKNSVRTLDAIRKLETLVLRARGIQGTVLRYASFYGPGTSFAPDGQIVSLVRAHKLPLVGDGGAVWSFLHIDDAANATRIAIESTASGVFNIADDDPAEVRIWLPELAKAAGAKPPMHLPAWIGRLMLGESGLSMMTKIRGSSNSKAKRVLGWSPAFPSWRQGFRSMLQQPA